jgi:hypothetical protein
MGRCAIDPATVTFIGHLPPTQADAAVLRDGTVGLEDATARSAQRADVGSSGQRSAVLAPTTATTRGAERESIGDDR